MNKDKKEYNQRLMWLYFIQNQFDDGIIHLLATKSD